MLKKNDFFSLKQPYLTCFTLGVLLGFSIIIVIKLCTDCNFKTSIDPVSVISILTNLFLAIFVAKIWGKSLEDQKEEKKVIIGFYTELQKKIALEIDTIIREREYDSQNARIVFQGLRTKLLSLNTLIRETGYVEKNEILLTNFEKSLSVIYTKLTNTIPQNNNEAAILLLNKNVKAENIKIDECIFKLIIKINSK